MAERKAHFRFVTEPKVTVLAKRTLATMVTRHVNDVVAISNRAYLRLGAILHLTRHLERIEFRMLETEVLEDDTDQQEDLRLAREASTALETAFHALEQLRTRKIETARVIEEAFDPIFAPKEEPKEKPVAAKQAAPDAPSPAEPEVAHPASPPGLTLTLPPELLEKARIEARKHEEAEWESRQSEYQAPR